MPTWRRCATSSGPTIPSWRARRRLVVGTKADLVEDAEGASRRAGPRRARRVRRGGARIAELVERLRAAVQTAADEEEERTAEVVLRPARPPFTVRREGSQFIVAGRNVERWVAETDLEDARRVVELQRRLVKAGVERTAVRDGGAPGRRGRDRGASCSSSSPSWRENPRWIGVGNWSTGRTPPGPSCTRRWMHPARAARVADAERGGLVAEGRHVPHRGVARGGRASSSNAWARGRSSSRSSTPTS